MATRSSFLVLILSIFLLSVTLALSSSREDERELQQCRQQCQQQGRQQQQQHCEEQCRERYEKRQEERGGSGRREGDDEEEEEEEEEQKSKNNPYVFGSESFVHRSKSQHGSIRVLKNFLQKSNLLLGIANYRVVLFEANPRTFAMPKHSDAEQVFFVARGEGTLTLIRNDEESRNARRESHSIRRGDIIRVHAGAVVYLINKSNNQKLQIAKLVQPVSTPGQFQDFYVVGGPNPESIYRTFSINILEASLNAQQEKLEKLFGQQREGEIVEASEEQIRSLSRSSEGGPWPFGGQSSNRPFSLLNKRPDHSNERGQLYRANFNDYRDLKDLNVYVTFANISRGSMIAPFYESKATKIAVVVEGRGKFEMVCPHRSSQKGQGSEQEEEEGSEEQQKEERQYRKVQSRLEPGTVFVVPVGHPTAIIASQDEDLHVLCFEVNAKNSNKVLLTGKNNVVSQLEREAKELSFGVSSRLVDEVFDSSSYEIFARSPRESNRRPLMSIM